MRFRLPKIEFGDRNKERPPAHPVVTYYLIIIPATLLTLFGLVMGFSASAVLHISQGESPYSAFLRQLGIIVISTLLAACVHMINPRWWYKCAPFIFVAALLAQLLVFTPLGREVGGNRNWIYLPILGQAQPSEFMKLAIIIFLARLVTRTGARLHDWKQMAATVGLAFVTAVGSIMLGRDLGTALVVMVSCVGALWVARLPAKWFGWAVIVSIPVMVLLVAMNPSRIRRVLDILPWRQSVRNLSAPEQIDHALWALGSGGLTGLGPGASREKWNYLQEGHTDFILAILGEEFGLLGTLSVLACIAVLVWALVRLCMTTTSPFVAVSSAGIASWIGIQAIINIFSVTKIGPVIGVPLPLVSYGGSSFFFTALALGVVAGFARDEAGMGRWGRPDESSAGRDPRVLPKRRPADKVTKRSRQVR
ncbi:FtsW/RodA/SpoVE family cell cycle protein [Schaalia sp. lx-100]|uniref:FtsW/RodA/SpoVE family cell cycle protein n=1 Tax=Schaalia sp. lx-100 TaxID=2899081 RepID=UPI001E4D819B|nr:putative peptidoglycan glycosyltransferase FtsW [Schaalia sp. lx-100]MCD4557051.1 putative lipid II flippase FtsW [Schaalia sp. lx-100]